MPKPYAMELRERVVSAVDGGMTQDEAAEVFSVGLKTVNRWVARRRETGSIRPSPMGGAHRACIVDEPGAALIRDILECVPDSTLRELCLWYESERGVRVSPQTMSDTVRRLNLTRKRGLFEARQGFVPKPKPPGTLTSLGKPSSTRPAWSSSTRRASTPR